MSAVCMQGPQATTLSPIVVNVLLAAKASADSVAVSGETALSIAAASCRVKVVKTLLAAKASMESTIIKVVAPFPPF
jgi:hypothetical protein